MSEHQNHTEFLRQCLLYDHSSERHQLEEKLTHAQRDLRCVQRAVWLMTRLTTLAAVGLVYALLLVDSFPDHTPPIIVNLIYAVCMGSLISLVAFMGLRIVFSRKLDRWRQECRLSVAKFLESRLGKPASPPWQQNAQATAGEVRAVLVANGIIALPR